MSRDRSQNPGPRAGLLAAFVLPGLLAGQLAIAQQPTPPTRASIDAEYRQALEKADRDHIARLTALAASQSGAEAEATYLDLFRFAVGSDRYRDAEPAAERILALGTKGREITFLASLINIMAEADRGQYAEAVKDLRAFVDSPFYRGEPIPEAQTRVALSIGEAFVRRLLKQSRFDDARSVAELIVQESRSPAVREHFQSYVRRTGLVGKPAPALEGQDVDGQPAGLSKFKGKVVLVVFWATWCPPCVENLPLLQSLAERYKADGFDVLGVNVDDGPDRDKVVRKFVVDFAIPWASVINGSGERDFATTYGVKEIPASVLVGRDGTVLNIDPTPDGLAEAIAKAVGKGTPSR